MDSGPRAGTGGLPLEPPPDQPVHGEYIQQGPITTSTTTDICESSPVILLLFTSASHSQTQVLSSRPKWQAASIQRESEKGSCRKLVSENTLLTGSSTNKLA